jgi:multidrug efflux pump subunit AcrA (membrane-fusion protein)
MAESKVAQEEVHHLQSHESSRRITAPFDGIVTERNTDVGALVDPVRGTDGRSNRPPFRVADVHKVRIFVKIPQQMTAGIATGVRLFCKQFKAVGVTSSGAIDVHSGTLLVELNADNPDGAL